MEPRWWQEWYRERVYPMLTYYDEQGPAYGWDDLEGLADEYDFDFDEGEY